VTRGVELHVDADHPLARLGSADQGLAGDAAPGHRETPAAQLVMVL